MSAPEEKKKISAGEIFGYAVLGGLGVGLGFYLLAMFFGMGVEAIGMAKRRYPEVIMGLIMLALLAAFMGGGGKKAEGGGDKKADAKH